MTFHSKLLTLSILCQYCCVPQGAFVGLICGLTWSFWIGIGAQVYPPHVDKPPRSTEGCIVANITEIEIVTEMVTEYVPSMAYTAAAANATAAAEAARYYELLIFL